MLTKTYTLNQGQQEAFDGLRNAILRKDHLDYRQFLLNGYAGTGKTFVMNRIVEAVKDIAPYINFGMTAPTHKAVKVLKKNSELKNRLDFGTIHSFLGLKQVLIEQRDGSYIETYKPDFSARRRIDGIRVLIIDESSMLADELFEHLQNELRSNSDLIIIYMGKQSLPIQNPSNCWNISKVTYYNVVRKNKRESLKTGYYETISSEASLN